MTKIIFCGCSGRMGQVVTTLADKDSQTEIVAGVDLYQNSAFSYPVFPTIQDCNIDADVIIDFSSPKVLDELLCTAKERSLPLVLCATGYTKEQIAKIEKAAEEIAILRSANMSLGINTIVKLVQMATQVLAAADFDIELIEKHHNQKLDAPSGTALLLADAMNEVLNNEYKYNYDRSKEHSMRSKKEIGISAVRGGSIVGEHEVLFAGIDEVIEIKHTAYSKSVFGNGAISAAKYMKGKSSGLYSMKDVIEG